MKISTKVSLNVFLTIFVFASIAILLIISIAKILKLSEAFKELPELQNKLATLTIQHYEWLEALGVGNLLLDKTFTKAKDPTKCDLGKWYYSYTPPEHLKDVYAKIEEPHRNFHATAEKIINAKNSGNMELAKHIFQTETLPNLAATRDALAELRTGFKVMVDDKLNEVNELLHQTRNIVILAFSITGAFLLIFSFFFLIKPLKISFRNLTEIANAVARGDFSSLR